MKKEQIDYKLWLIVIVGFLLAGVIGAVAAFLGYVLVDRHNKKKERNKPKTVKHD